MIRISATVGLAAALALPPALAFAQQPAAAPPTWQQGRPDSMASSPLAPHAPRLTATAPDRIPIGSLRVPQGFKVEVWAHGAPGARMMAESPNGTVFVGTRTIGRVYAVSEEGGQRRVRTLLQQLNQPNGVAVRDGNLYVVAINRVLRFDGIEGKLDNPGTPADLTAAFNLPTEEHHGWKFLAFSPDGRLTMNTGVPCNVCEFDRDRFANIISFRPDGSDRRVEARGIRNSVGFDWHPTTRELWATNNGRDWAGNDIPNDTLHRIRRPGEDHGFPFCVGSWNDPAVPRRECSEFVQPAALLGAACGGARGAVLHREHVPGAVPQPALHRAARVVEPRAAFRLRRGGGADRRGRQRGRHRALPDRLPRGRQQRVPRPAGGRAATARRLAPGERRAERRDLPHLAAVSPRALALAAAALAAAAASVSAPAAAQDAARGAALAEERGCGACHGEKGIAAQPPMPSLAGQPAEFVVLQMILFRERLRDAPPMPDLAQGLEDGQIEDLGAHFAALPPGPPPDRGEADAARMREGEALAQRLNCGVCHLPSYAGRAQIPRVAGQREEYLVQALAQYRDGTRRGSDTNMNAVMYGVTDPQIAALAHFLAQR